MCFKFFNKKIKKMKWYDMSFTKLSVMAITLMIAKLWSGILYLDWYYYLIIFALLVIVPLVDLFKK